MRRFLVAMLLFQGMNAGLAQWVPEFSGYVVTMPAALSLPQRLADSAGVSRMQGVEVTRLRLRPSLTFPWDGLLEVEYEISGIVRRTGQNFLIDNPDVARQVADLRWTPVEGRSASVVHFIDRFVYRHRLSFGEIAVGRQRISWGTGRIWNPTDLFNPINPANFAKLEKDGSDAVSAKTALGTLSDVQVVWNPVRKERANYAARVRVNVGEYDFSGVGGYFDGEAVLGGDFAGSISTMGVHGELLARGIGGAAGDRRVRAVLGIDYQITPELFALAEVHYNGAGTRNKQVYDIEALFRGVILNVAQRYVALMASYLVHPLVTVTGMGTGNMDDGSRFYLASVSYSALDELTVGGGIQWFTGGEGDEYTQYPDTWFLKVEFFF